MSKKVGVLFSGGLDSTYLIWKNLKDGNEVFPIYVEIGNNIDKTIIEKNRIELLHKKFKTEFNGDGSNNKGTIHDVKYLMKIHINSLGGGLRFTQMPVWIMIAIYSAGSNLDEFQIGYVMNDDAISYLTEFKKIYKSYEYICDDMIPLTFPLIKYNKDFIVSRLPKDYIELTVSCEIPKNVVNDSSLGVVNYEPCGDCPACKKIISNGYYIDSQLHKNYKNVIIYNNAISLYSNGYKVVDSNGVDYMSVVKENCQPLSYQLEIPFTYDDDIVYIEY